MEIGFCRRWICERLTRPNPEYDSPISQFYDLNMFTTNKRKVEICSIELDQIPHITEKENSRIAVLEFILGTPL